MATPPFRLYLITDRLLVPDLPAAVERALSAIPRGAAAVQLREKDLSARALLDLAKEVGSRCRRHGAALLVNDRIDVALAAGADGVHLSGSSVSVQDARALLGDRWIGASCHDAKEIERASGADFATFGPVFPSRGKPRAIGLDSLAAHAGALPLFALGGIDSGNAADAIAHCAHGVAAIRSWIGDGDPAEATALLYDAAAARAHD